MTSGGGDRSYSRYIPAGLKTGVPAPLVLDLAAYSPASQEETFSGFTTPDRAGRVKADEVGAIVITPEPVNGAGALRTWNYKNIPWWTDDQLFIADLLDDVEGAACVDSDRILLMGFAVGGVFASIVACEQADRFAALVTVSGLYSGDDCRPKQPLPVLSFHGTDDRFIPFTGGVGDGAGGLGLSDDTAGGLLFMGVRPGAQESSQAWADHNRCGNPPVSRTVSAGVTSQTWGGCADDAGVELYVIDGGGHTWPGSVGMVPFEGLLGPVDRSVVANDVIWDFFAASTAPR